MPHNDLPLTEEQERKIARAERRIQRSERGFPPEHWIERKKAKLVSAVAIRYRDNGKILRVGHRHDRGSDYFPEGRWVIVHSFWRIPKWGIMVWVYYPLGQRGHYDNLMGSEEENVELNPPDVEEPHQGP
jgi:hypothetical protein